MTNAERSIKVRSERTRKECRRKSKIEALTEECNLHEFLYPLEPTRFFSEHWERSPCLVARQRPTFYSDLFSSADVDVVIQLTSLTSSDDDVRIVKTEGERCSDRPLPRTGDGAPDIYYLYQAYHGGHTIIVNGLHRRWKKIATLCRSLEDALHHRVGANSYFTPQHSQGFSAHFDTHDVFILQLEGSKTWRLYDAVPLPLADAHRPVSGSEIGPLRQQIILRPGDLLYIPRGHIHEAVGSSRPSLHLTLGIHVFRWIDLMRDLLLVAAEENVAFRRALPIGFMQSDTATDLMKCRLSELLDVLTRDSYAEQALRRFSDGFAQRGSPSPDGHFSCMNRIRAINLNTVVTRRRGMICSTFVEDNRAGVRFPGNTVTGPVQLEPTFRYIAKAGRFAVRNLPNSLTDEAKLVLIRRLIREGLLTITHKSVRVSALQNVKEVLR
jgi:ribosomal protein L16 Arg81 hydroxylase